MISPAQKIQYVIWDDHLCLIMDKHRNDLHPTYYEADCLSPIHGRFNISIHEESVRLKDDHLEWWRTKS